MKASKGADFGDDRERYGMTHPESVPLRVKEDILGNLYHAFLALDTIADVSPGI
jgi:hypothetical protein